MSDRPAPTPEDLAAATQRYRHSHAGPGGADHVEIFAHPSGDYLHHAWGVDPDHGDYDRLRWVPAAEGPALIESTRASDLALYPESAPLEQGDFVGAFGLVALIAAFAGLAILWLARVVSKAMELPQ